MDKFHVIKEKRNMRTAILEVVKGLIREIDFTGTEMLQSITIVPDVQNDYIEEALNQTPSVLITDGSDYVEREGDEGAYFLHIKIWVVLLVEIINSGNQNDFRNIADAIVDKIGAVDNYYYKGMTKGLHGKHYLYGLFEIEYESEVQ